MHKLLRQMLNQIRINNAKRRKRQLAVLVLSLFVASSVLWQLKITGITMTGEALCGYLEHQHSQACVEKTLTCGQEEAESHAHTDGCMGEDGAPICGMEETEGHAHNSECYTETYICGFETEHTHTVLCYSDKNADLETSADWEKTLPGLTGDPAADLVAVARSQVGYFESQRNYVVSDDGVTQRGYTRYGEWYGNPYGNWSAMFVSFCLNYAEHPAYQELANSGVETMRRAAEKLGYCREAGYLPEVGDLVFLDRDGSGAADAVAVVSSRNGTTITAIEGDYDDAVQKLSCAVDDSAILAYAQLPQSDNAVLMLSDDGEDDTALTSETGETIFGTMEGYPNIYTVTLDVKYVPVDQNGNTLQDIPSYSDTISTFYSGYVTSDGGVMGYSSNDFRNHVSSLGYNLQLSDLHKVTIHCNSNGGATVSEQAVYVNVTNDLYYFQINQSNFKIGETGNWTVTDSWNPYMIVYYYASPIAVTFTDGESEISTQSAYPGTVIDLSTIGSYVIGETVNSEGAVLSGWKDTSGTVYTTSVTVGGAAMSLTPVWANDTVTVTFQNTSVDEGTGEETPVTVATYTLLAGEKLSVAVDENGTAIAELPVAAEKEGYVFVGWFEEGEAAAVTLDTVISKDTTFAAVYEEVKCSSVIFHDILPDETEADVTIDLLVEKGQTLSEAIALSDASLVDGTVLSDCVWYTLADGAKTKIDLSMVITEDMELYTYTYQIVLTLNPQSAQTMLMSRSIVDVTTDEDGTMTLTITAREGEKPTAADFVVDGVDYSLYTWTYQDSDGGTQTLNISDLIANGVTENITATSDTGSLAIGSSETTTKNINFYVFVDDGRVLVETRTVTAYRFSDTRWYIPAATLESVYAKYGFKAEQLQNDTHYFPHVDTNGDRIWGDTAVKSVAIGTQTVYFSPITNNDRSGCDVYYLPEQTVTGSAEWNEQIAANTFYTVTVSDGAHLVYTADADIPPVSYVFTGGDATVTVLIPEDGNTVWQANGVPLTDGVNNGNGTITYTITNITEPIVITPQREGLYTITYDINLTSDPVGTAPTIKGQSTYVDAFDSTAGGSYVVLTPSKTEYTRNGDNSLVTLTFAGWDTVGDGTPDLQAGQVLTAEELASNVTLTAVWTDQGYTGSVSFYVNLKCEVVDYGGGSTPTTSNNDYTSALYGTSVSVNPTPNSYPSGNTTGANGGIVIDGTDTAEVDSIIRQFATGSISASYGSTDDYIERAFALGSFPDDELILAQIRTVQAAYIKAYLASGYSSVDGYRNEDPANNKIIAIDGEYVPAEDITSENFTVRWYVFKYDATNGWHVDGVLVKKQGQLTVTKTFYGNSTAINQVKESYTISVNDGTNDIYTLNLDAKSDTNAAGYTAYDAATDTYTWTIPLTAGRQFTLKENNYRVADTIVPGVTMATVAEYMVTNTDSQSTVSRTAYLDSGVTVTAKAYSVDLNYTNYQTVKFYNSYLPTNVMMLSKVDDYGNPLSGVKFQLKFKNQVVQLFQNTDGYYYIYSEEGTARVDGDYITTDTQGNAIIVGLKDQTYAGQYTLTEVTPPAGYTTISDIVFNASSDGTITLTEHPNAELTGDGLVIRVKNTSETMSVTAIKEWTDSTNKPVKVTLCLDGTPMAGYEVDLKASNNWTYTWDNLPAYVGGKLGSYSIRETWIGDTAYSATVDDGYEDYVVTYSNPSYTYDENGKPETLTLKVTNRTYSGGVEFTKVNENNAGLAGATFQLYTDAACTTPYGSAVTSDASGRVSFGNLTAGIYYMKETQAPSGYKSNAAIYQIRVTGSGTTIKVYDPDSNGVVGDALTTIRNEPATASLLVKKVDESGNSLTGARFELYKDGTKVTIGGKNAFDVDASGQLLLEDLTPGSYTLKETAAPAGYYRLTEEIPFTVSEGKIICTGQDGKWSFSDTDNTFTITVTNVAGSELPHTGGMGTHYGTMAGLLMMAGSLLYGFLLRRKRERGGSLIPRPQYDENVCVVQESITQVYKNMLRKGTNTNEKVNLYHPVPGSGSVSGNCCLCCFHYHHKPRQR